MPDRCEQEMCPNWDGEGCPCGVLGLDKQRGPFVQGHSHLTRDQMRTLRPDEREAVLAAIYEDATEKTVTGGYFHTFAVIEALLAAHECLVFDDGTTCRDHLPETVRCANCCRNVTSGAIPPPPWGPAL